MNRPPIPLLLAVLTAVLAFPMSTRADDLRPGDRVRVNATDEAGKFSQVTGTFVSLDNGALVVKKNVSGHLRDYDTPSEQTQAIPLGSITSVDRSLGTERHTAAGTLIGAAGGIVLGLVIWEAEKSSDTGTNDFDQALTQTVEAAAAPAYMLLFGALGAGVGAIIGHASGDEKWDRVDGLSVGWAPTGFANGAVTVSLDIDF
jgi:hypothetical protein